VRQSCRYSSPQRREPSLGGRKGVAHQRPSHQWRREWDSNAQRARGSAELQAGPDEVKEPNPSERVRTDDGAYQSRAVQRSPRDRIASALEDAIRAGRQSGDLALARMAHAWLGQLLDELEPGGVSVSDLSDLSAQRKRKGR
jgi:hypothetical protein